MSATGLAPNIELTVIVFSLSGAGRVIAIALGLVVFACVCLVVFVITVVLSICFLIVGHLYVTSYRFLSTSKRN